jgi:hypothetical protein
MHYPKTSKADLVKGRARAGLGDLPGMGDTAEPFLDVLGAYWSDLGHAAKCGNAK